MSLTRILVCGGRDANIDFNIADNCISEIVEDYYGTDIEFVSGSAKGADKLGEEYANFHSYPVIQFKPDWGKYGRAAGPIRNKEMIEYIDECDNPVVIAFWDGISKGTRSTIKLAQDYDIPVHIIRYKNYGEIIESSIIAGMQLDGDSIVYNWDEDEPEDILPLVNQKIVQSTKNGHVFYYAFKANKGHDDWKKFLDVIKHTDDLDKLKYLTDKIMHRLLMKFNYFDCVFYPKSSSKLNSLMIESLHEIDPYIPAYEVSKVSPDKVEFDWDKFNKTYTGDKEKAKKKIDYMMDKIHKSDKFSLQHQVYGPFRKYITNFINIDDFEIALDDIVESQSILILDDIVTTSRTTTELIRTLTDIGFEGDIVIFSLIYNK